LHNTPYKHILQTRVAVVPWLQVNYRASSGFGKRFLHLGDGQWGVGTMQHDLTDAVAWAVAAGIADESRVAIYGGSYGG
jgi:dipeptidyl aminopeptidase/acylaminoacyl peptidase